MEEEFAAFVEMSEDDKMNIINQKRSPIFKGVFTYTKIPFPLLLAVTSCSSDLFLHAFDTLQPENLWNNIVGPGGGSCLDAFMLAKNVTLATAYLNRIVKIEDAKKREELVRREISLLFFDLCIQQNCVDLFMLGMTHCDVGYLVAAEHEEQEPVPEKRKSEFGPKTVFPTPLTSLFCITRDRLISRRDGGALLLLRSLLKKIHTMDIDPLITFKTCKWKKGEVTSAGHAFRDMASPCSKNYELRSRWMQCYYYFTRVASIETAQTTNHYGTRVDGLLENESHILPLLVRKTEVFPNSKWKFFIHIDLKNGTVMIDPCGQHDFSLAKRYVGVDRGEHFLYAGVLYTIKHFLNDVIGVDFLFDTDKGKTVTFRHHDNSDEIRDLVGQALLHLSSHKVHGDPMTINLESVKGNRQKNGELLKNSAAIPAKHMHAFNEEAIKNVKKVDTGPAKGVLAAENTFVAGASVTDPSYDKKWDVKDLQSVFRSGWKLSVK